MCVTVSGANNGPVMLGGSHWACGKCPSPWAGMLLYSIPQNGSGSGPDTVHLVYPIGDSYYYVLR